jgi:L-ascorbate metabolism protein UlaG (beta-lactamase superfamily)
LGFDVPRRKVNCACLATPLAGLIKPKVAIPCHYDMFPYNAADPQLFRAALRYKAPYVGYHQLEYVKPFVFNL